MFTKIYRALKGAFALLPKSWRLIVKNWQLFAVVNSVPLLLTVLGVLNRDTSSGVTLNSTGTYNINWAQALGLSAGLAAVFMIITVVLQIMATRLALDVATNNPSSLARLWNFAREYFLRLIGMGIVAGLIAIGISVLALGVPTLIFNVLGIGIVGLIIGGLVMAAVFILLAGRYYLAPYALIDKDLGIFDSFTASRKMSEGKELQVISILVVTLVLAVVPMVLGRVGEVVSAGLGIAYSVAPALRYVELRKANK